MTLRKIFFKNKFLNAFSRFNIMVLKKDFSPEGKLTERYLNTTYNKILCSDNC